MYTLGRRWDTVLDSTWSPVVIIAFLGDEDLLRNLIITSSLNNLAAATSNRVDWSPRVRPGSLIAVGLEPQRRRLSTI